MVVLACGGFEANPEMRLRYLGSRLETWSRCAAPAAFMGTMLTQALLARVLQPVTGAVAMPARKTLPILPSATWPDDKLSRYSFPYSLLIPAATDTASSTRARTRSGLTYAKTGSTILAQGQWPIRYSIRRPSTFSNRATAPGPTIEAPTLAELARRLGVPADNLMVTVASFSNAVATDADVQFDPLTLDGLSARPGGQPVKSNMGAGPGQVPTSPYPVTCGILLHLRRPQDGCRP